MCISFNCSVTLQGVSINSALSVYVQGLSVSTASSVRTVDVQDVSLSPACCVDVQSVSIFAVSSMDLQVVSLYLFPFATIFDQIIVRNFAKLKFYFVQFRKLRNSKTLFRDYLNP